MTVALRFMVERQVDVEEARRGARKLAASIGFNADQTEDIVVAVSELATNLMRYASEGSITLSAVDDGDRTGMRIESRDTGPGIDDVERALQDGYSTSGSLGSGLSIARRLMDDLHIESDPIGTWILAHKWKRPH